MRRRGIGVAELHSTAGGEDLRKSFGFTEPTTSRQMRLDLS